MDGDDDGLRFRLLVAERLHHGDPRAVGQAEIQERELKTLAGHGSERISDASAFGDHGAWEHLLNQGLQPSPDLWNVFKQQDVVHGGRQGSGWRGVERKRDVTAQSGIVKRIKVPHPGPDSTKH